MSSVVITVFSIHGCPHCMKVKAFLSDNGFEYSEISLTEYPASRSGMLQLAGKLSVPQVFVGDNHVGDAAATVALGAEQLRRLVEPASPPTDHRLQKPQHPPTKLPAPSGRKEGPVKLRGGDMTYLEAAQEVAKRVEKVKGWRRASFFSKAHKGCFTGDQLVTALGHAEDASEVIRRSIVLPVGKDMYRLHQDEYPDVLNRYRTWKDRVDPPDVIIVVLKKRFSDIQQRHRDSAGLVDYADVSRDPEWPGFLEAFCEVQGVDLAAMPPPSRRAFLINLYNLSVLVAFAKVGIASGSLARYRFFDKVYVDVGGVLYSFNALESGLLRGNRPAPYHLSPPLPKTGAVSRLAVPADPRIHFALNCGAKSCPPVKSFTGDALEEELGIVTAAFLESDDNLVVKEDRITTTQIVGWYLEDFGGSPASLLDFLIKHTSGDRRTRLEDMKKRRKGDVTVSYFPYNWETDSCGHAVYKGPVPLSRLCC